MRRESVNPCVARPDGSSFADIVPNRIVHGVRVVPRLRSLNTIPGN